MNQNVEKIFRLYRFNSAAGRLRVPADIDSPFARKSWDLSYASLCRKRLKKRRFYGGMAGALQVFINAMEAQNDTRE